MPHKGKIGDEAAGVPFATGIDVNMVSQKFAGEA